LDQASSRVEQTLRLRSFRRCPSLAALLAATLALGGCGPRYTFPSAPPLVLERPAPPIPIEACAPSAEPIAPSGRTPLPVAEGELALLDVRGDDRLAFAGAFVATWSGDGERLVTAIEDSVLIWSVHTGELERRLDLGSPLRQLSHVVVSPDGAWIAVSGDASLRVERPEASTWLLRANGAAPARRFAGSGGDLRFTPDSRRLVGNGHAWDVETGAYAAAPRVTGEALFLPDGRRVLVFVESAPSPRRRLVPELRELATGATIHRFPAVESSIHAALSGDGRSLAILDGALSVYSTDTFERVALVRDVERAGMVHLSQDGRRAVLETLRCAVPLSSSPRRGEDWCAPPALAVWDLDRTERLLHTAHEAGSGWVFSRDGAYLTGTDTRLVEEILRVKDGASLRFGARIRSISPDSRWVLFDGKQGHEIASLDGSGAPPAFSRAPRVLARSADGRFVADVDGEGRLRLEGPGSCARLGVIAGPWIERSPYDHLDEKDEQVAFSPDAASLFTVTGSSSGRVAFRAFRTSDGAERWSIRSTGSHGAGAYVLPSAGQVLFQGEGRFEVRRFDATTGAELEAGRAPGVSYERVPFSAEVVDVRDPDGERPSALVSPAATRDGRTLATFADLRRAPHLSLWDLLAPRGVVDVVAGGWPTRLSLSPDERLWAAGLRDGTIRLFARDGSRSIAAASGHAAPITAMVFTRSGDRLATAAEDGAVLLVDTSSGAVVGRARLPLDHATHLWISPDGRELWADTERALRVRFRIAPR
jgi:WD40 repeat protein